MFKLEQAILEWRRQMVASGIRTPVPLDELENHLRDEIEARTQSGLSSAQAFRLAVEKFGEPEALRSEFSKVEAARAMRLRGTLSLLGTTLFSLAIIGGVWFRAGNFSLASPAEQAASLAAAVMIILLVFGGWWGYRFFPVIPSQKRRNAILVVGGVGAGLWCLFLAFSVLPRFDLTIGQLLVTVLWALVTPTAALYGAMLGLERAASTKT